MALWKSTMAVNDWRIQLAHELEKSWKIISLQSFQLAG